MSRFKNMGDDPYDDDLGHDPSIAMFEIGKWYKTEHGHEVEFVRHIENDGMYNVFRHTKETGYRPMYTDEHGYTAYGDRVLPNTSTHTTSKDLDN